MKSKIVAFAVVMSLAGCSTTPEQLETAKSTATQTRSYPDNYQALYRKVYGPASRCLVASAGGMTQLLLDAQLYPDLGFGEMNYSMNSIYGRDYWAKIKIEKAGSGSKMTVSAAHMWASEKRVDTIFSWAEGKTSC